MNITKAELQKMVDKWVSGCKGITSDQILHVLELKNWTLGDDCRVIEK